MGGEQVKFSGQVKNQCVYVPTGRIWPSGDFSLGYVKVDGDSRVDYRREPNRVAAQPLPAGWSIGRYGIPVQSAPSRWEGLSVDEWCEWQWLRSWHPPMALECPRLGGVPLDLTNLRNSHSCSSRPEKYGKTGITGYGRKMVKSAATLIQRMPGKRITFATVTMPTLPPQLRRELAQAWPELVRQLLQWLTRKLKRLGLIPAVCSVSEIQPGRLKTYSEAYLHLHLVWPNHWAKAGNWSIDCDEMRSWVSEFLQRKGLWASESWVNIDTQRVKKTAAGYLSKYMSKGAEEIAEFAKDCGWESVPSQWWNLTKPARDLVKKYTWVGVEVGGLLDAVVNHALSDQQLHQFHVLQPAILAYDGRERIVGWYGVLIGELRQELVKMLRDNSRIIDA